MKLRSSLVPRPALLAATLVAFLAVALSAAAQSRIVIVNDRLMDPASLARLDRLACATIPDGSYWLDPRTGAWGYGGDPRVRGVIGEACRTGAGAQNLDGTYGPYATMRRAEEVAQDFRRRGLRAVAFHNGDGYYVRASR